MKRIGTFLTIMAVSALSYNASAQQGEFGIGARGTFDGAGLNVRGFVTDHFVIEGQANAGGFTLDGTSVSGVLLLEGSANISDQWRLYLGGGGHAGLWDRKIMISPSNDDGSVIVNDNQAETIYGLDGIIGAEYRLPGYDMSVTIDVKPAMNFADAGVEFFPHNLVGVGLKYVIK